MQDATIAAYGRKATLVLVAGIAHGTDCRQGFLIHTAFVRVFDTITNNPLVASSAKIVIQWSNSDGMADLTEMCPSRADKDKETKR